ncbi:SgcJ/EcaC family oxidoreductase [Pararhodobacter aggregans]|uniref:SgcJ/EcaC family oxidoreductase n=1 Tax=Pararhodobacter aggregans TaxID=404875 RepID=UPI003A909B5A
MHALRSLIVALAFLLSLTPAAAQVATPREAADRMVAAVAARDAAAVAALYAPEAIVLVASQPVIAGREAIGQAWARNFAGGYAALAILQARTDTGSDRAAMVILWEATIRPQGAAPQTIRGRSLLYFIRAAQGWLISADMSQVPG